MAGLFSRDKTNDRAIRARIRQIRSIWKKNEFSGARADGGRAELVFRVYIVTAHYRVRETVKRRHRRRCRLRRATKVASIRRVVLLTPWKSDPPRPGMSTTPPLQCIAWSVDARGRLAYGASGNGRAFEFSTRELWSLHNTAETIMAASLDDKRLEQGGREGERKAARRRKREEDCAPVVSVRSVTEHAHSTAAAACFTAPSLRTYTEIYQIARPRRCRLILLWLSCYCVR